MLSRAALKAQFSPQLSLNLRPYCSPALAHTNYSALFMHTLSRSFPLALSYNNLSLPLPLPLTLLNTHTHILYIFLIVVFFEMSTKCNKLKIYLL